LNLNYFTGGGTLFYHKKEGGVPPTGEKAAI